MNWLAKGLRDVYWSVRHILAFWSVVIVNVLAQGLPFFIIIAVTMVLFYFSQSNRDANAFLSQTVVPILLTAGAIILGALVLHEPARMYFAVKKEAERQNWDDVQISLRKYPKGHRFHGVVIVVRNFKLHPIKELQAMVITVEQNGLPQSGKALAHRLPQARDRVYIWEKGEMDAGGGAVEVVLLHLPDESETYGNIPSEGKTHESQDFIEIKGENGHGLMRVELNGNAGDIKMKPKIMEYSINWKDGRLAMKTESRVARWLKNVFQPYH